MLVDRDKGTCPARHKFRQNILGDGRLFVLSDIRLHCSAGQLHIGILRRPRLRQFFLLPEQILLQKVPVLVRRPRIEGTDSVSDAGHILVGELLRLHG